MRLWTFQAIKSVQELQGNRKLVAMWDRYSPQSPWTKAYQWMAEQMTSKDVDCKGNAPIWAWHSCGGPKEPPTLDVARNLLSDIEIESGIQTIEFECPDHLALLTNYDDWCSILFRLLDGLDTSKIEERDIQAMYPSDFDHLEEYEAIQATLPYLCLDWVVEIRDLNLVSGNFDYDPNERV